MHSILRLRPYLDRYRRTFWWGIAGLLLARVFEALIPLMLRFGINEISAGKGSLVWPTLGIVGCVVALFLCIVFSRRAIRLLGVGVAYDLRKRIYSHLQDQGPMFFGRNPTGDLMARAINDVQLVRQMVGLGARTVLVLVFSALVGLGFMIGESPSLALWLLLPMPLITGWAYVLAGRVYDASMKVQEGFSDLSDNVQENFGGIRTVQALVQEEAEIARFSSINQAYSSDYEHLIRTNSFLSALMPVLGASCTLIVLTVGGGQVLRGELSIGAFASFFWYIGMVLWPVREAGNMVNLLQRGAAATTRIFEILDQPVEIPDRSPAGTPDSEPWVPIAVKKLTFFYPEAKKAALKDLSLEIRAGETVAILGRVGSGKTTLLRLLTRILEAPEGTVLLGGRDVRERSLGELRRQVALVPQQAFLFAATLRENLAYDDPERSIEEVESAAQGAALDSTVTSFRSGYDTLVGERGVTLSGGQKQRATLARGLIRHAPILLLDDCFSAVDTETEEHILSGLRERRKNGTTVLVSHRVSTARRADRIFVLEEGRLLESGTHEELVAAGGFYAELDQAQRRRGKLLGRLHEQEEEFAAKDAGVGGRVVREPD